MRLNILTEHFSSICLSIPLLVTSTKDSREAVGLKTAPELAAKGLPKTAPLDRLKWPPRRPGEAPLMAAKGSNHKKENKVNKQGRMRLVRV